MARRDVVVLGASAGGIEVMARILADAAAADAAFVVVVHMGANARTALPHILARATGLDCRLAVDGDRLEHGRVLVAPPDRQVNVSRGFVRVVIAPSENRSRPAIDPVFRTAAAAYGPRVVAVALSGVLDDGTAGAAAVRRRGGIVVVQDPADALFADIPRNIIDHVGADHVLPAAEIGALLTRLTAEEVPDAVPEEHEDAPPADQDRPLDQAHGGEVTHFTCPECSGPLWAVVEDGILRFRCRVGHMYSPDALRADEIEARAQVIRDVLDGLTPFREPGDSGGS